MRNLSARAVAVLLLLSLSSCTDATAEDAAEGIFVTMMQFFLMMMMLAALFFLMWAMIFAGAATLLIAGLRRLFGQRDEPPPAGPQLPPEPGVGPLPPAASQRSPGEQRFDDRWFRGREPDWAAVVMVILGGLLVLAAAPVLFGVSIGHTTPGEVTIPLPLLIVGAALVWMALRRRRP